MCACWVRVCANVLQCNEPFPHLFLQAVQALVRKHEEAYLESEEQGDREFWVAFYNKPQTLPLRQLKTGSIGQLICFKVPARSSAAAKQHCILEQQISTLQRCIRTHNFKHLCDTMPTLCRAR